MPTVTIYYRFDGEPRTHALETNETSLSEADAVRHLIELHHGDAENSLLMPDAEATEAQVLEQAEVLKIAEVRVESAGN